MSDYDWLIEAPGLHYLGARTLGKHEFHWTRDHDKALRFYSSEQADQAMMAIRELDPDLFDFARQLGEAKPVEHGWSDYRRTVAPIPENRGRAAALLRLILSADEGGQGVGYAEAMDAARAFLTEPT